MTSSFIRMTSSKNMDQKKATRTGQHLRNSPRLKGLEKKNEAHPKKENEVRTAQEDKPSLEAKTTSNEKATPEIVSSISNSPKTPCTSTRRNGTSRNSTPCSSSMQRELRKIEDYWTRQDPVKPDSPRLRYPKRRDTVNEELKSPSLLKKKDSQASTPKAKKTNDEFLSESPIPKCKDDLEEASDPGGTKLGLVNAEIVAELDEIPRKRFQPCNEQTCESSDDYMPPRKKLRSEVKQDELWEGIPLTISFKRLTPLLKQNDDHQNCDIDKESKTQDCSQNIESGGVQKPRKEINGHENKQELIEKIIIEKSINSAEEQILDDTTNDGTKGNSRNLFDDINKSIIVVKERTPSTPRVKRNTRLQVKNQMIQKSKEGTEKVITEEFLTESKQSDRREDGLKDETKLGVTKPFPSIEDDSRIPKAKGGDSEKNKQESCGLASKVQSTALDNVNKTDRNDCSSLNRYEKNNKCVEGMANMSISQILSCDSQNSISDNSFDVPEVANTVEITLETSTASECVHEVVDKTNILKNTETNTCNLVREDFQCSAFEKGSEESNKSVECLKVKDCKTKEITETSKATDEGKPTSDNDVDSDDSVKEKLSTKQRDAAQWFTLIKGGNSEKSKKIPPLKIMLKNTKHKLWQIKTRKDKKRDKCIKNKKKHTDEEKPSTSTTVEQAKTIQENDKGFDENESGEDDDQDYTPSTKRIKRKTLDRRASRNLSPPSNLNLRLNSERRLAMVNGLLSNKVLNNHACLIWSSENRRHMQLSHPKSSTSELDNLLREKWSELCEKEKLKYLQRAWHASKDENKHSSRRNDSYQMPEKQQQGHPSIERFLKMGSKKQHEEIKQWLQFYYEVSPEIYFCVINQFRDCLQTEKQEQENLENVKKQKQKTKKCKTKKLSNEKDADAKHRRLMFEAVLGYQKEVLETWADKKETQAQLLRENFNNLVKKLVLGEEVDLSKSVKSTKLTETLQDLKDLEKEKKLTISGESTNDNTYATLLNELDEYLKDRKGNYNLLKSLENTCVDHEKVEEYLTVTNKMDGHKMPILNAVAIKHVLDNVCPKTKRQRNLSIFKKQTTSSPASKMTEWVADDVIRANPNVDFRQGGISLLSHKVRKRPAILSISDPEKHDVPSTSNCYRKMQSILTSNRNQNCYQTVTYTFTRDQNSKSIISKLKRLQYDNGN